MGKADSTCGPYDVVGITIIEVRCGKFQNNIGSEAIKRPEGTLQNQWRGKVHDTRNQSPKRVNIPMEHKGTSL